jgi:hypothetical protein
MRPRKLPRMSCRTFLPPSQSATGFPLHSIEHIDEIRWAPTRRGRGSYTESGLFARRSGCEIGTGI